MNEEIQTCQRRLKDWGNWQRKEGLDRWQVMPNGDRCCSFCGSLHPDDFIAIAEAYANGEPGYRFDHSDKSYKVYANRPGIQNAGQGGIKFYKHHVDATPGPDLDRRTEIFDRALERSRAEFMTFVERAPS